MRITWLLLLCCVSSKSAWASPDEFSIVLTGNRDAVLSVVEKSLRAEVSNGSLSQVSGATGYQMQWRSFATRQTILMVTIRPLAMVENRSEPEAFNLGLSYRTESGDGMFHIRPLKVQIAKQAASFGQGVSVVSNQQTALYTTFQKKGEDCYANLRLDAELSEISNKVSLFGPSSTVTMMADDTKPNADEKKVVGAWGAKRDLCAQILRVDADYFPGNPQVAAALDGADKFNRLIVSLYKGGISYGEFAQRRSELNSASRQQNVDMLKERSDAQIRAAEAEQRRQIQQQAANAESTRAAVEMLKAGQSQPTMQMLQPTINCTSRAVAGGVNTNCR